MYVLFESQPHCSLNTAAILNELDPFIWPINQRLTMEPSYIRSNVDTF